MVIHNDYRFDSVVLDPSDPMTIIGVLSTGRWRRYFRFFLEQTKDERFGRLIFAIHILEKQEKIVMEQSNL